MSVSKWKPYPNYTESNFEFIPQYPLHWELKRMQWIGKFSASGIDKKSVETESDCLMVNYTDVYGNETAEIYSNQELMKTTATSQKIMEHHLDKGDMLFTPSSETVEDIGVSSVAVEDMPEIVYSYHLTRFRPSIPLGVDFSRFFCNSTPVLSQLSAVARGTTRQILSRNDFNTLYVAIPPKEERRKIGHFLSNKTRQITASIKHLENNLSLLEEKRSALIIQAVTRGLNPDVEMKYSGINSIGKIPMHWEIITAKHLEKNISELVQTGPFGAQLHASDYIEDDINGIPLILIKNVRDLKISSHDIPRISPDKAESLSLYRLKKEDIVFSRVGSVGRIAKVSQNEVGWLISGQMLRLRFTTDRINTDYAVYSISSKSILNYFELQSVGTTRDSINSTILSEMPMIVPPIEEQDQIVKYLNEKNSYFIKTMDRIVQQLEKLTEYRKALISAAVTGKIDVMGYSNER